MKLMSKWLRKASWLILALLLAFSTLTACSSEDVSDVLDIAIEVLDALETAEDSIDVSDVETSEEVFEEITTEAVFTEKNDADEATTDAILEETTPITEEQELELDPDGWYSTKEEVALYIHLYGELPGNYIKKNKAKDLGWESSEGNLWDVAPGKSIGGDRYYNNDDQLPEVKGRKYYECDINFDGGYRGGERIVFSNDGLIYYTGDHYNSFELLYGEE